VVIVVVCAVHYYTVTSGKNNCSCLLSKREASNTVSVPPVEDSDQETKEIRGYLQ
jgi:hypothetical protein